MMKNGNYRFENLQVWKDAMVQTKELFILVRRANMENNYAFASQFSRALISITNNIAEGSGSVSDREFANFLNMAHRSLFECVSMLYLAEMEEFITKEEREKYRSGLAGVSKQIEGFRRHLVSKEK